MWLSIQKSIQSVPFRFATTRLEGSNPYHCVSSINVCCCPAMTQALCHCPFRVYATPLFLRFAPTPSPICFSVLWSPIVSVLSCSCATSSVLHCCMLICLTGKRYRKLLSWFSGKRKIALVRQIMSMGAMGLNAYGRFAFY